MYDISYIKISNNFSNWRDIIIMSESEVLILIGKNISNFRKQKKLKLQDFGALCGIEHGNLIPIEKGRINVTIKTLNKIANVLEIELIDLFKK